jgi:glycerophosphoryl diester phosphodiesterase
LYSTLKYIAHYLLWLTLIAVPVPEITAQHFIQTNSTAELQSFFRRSSDWIPLISAHRGGPEPGFPENCIATFANTLQSVPAIIECDVQLSKDGQLVMMHDDKLDRTSNGSGKLSDYTLAELQQLRLKDNDGQLTDFRIPTLDSVLQWGRRKTIIQIDVKRGVAPEQIVKAIHRNQAQAYSVVITYSITDALTYHRLDSSLMLSVTVRNSEDLQRLEQSGIPYAQVVAFVGVSEPEPDLYEALHRRGIACILGTMGNLDNRAAARRTNIYAGLVKNGADILATDRPLAAYQAIQPLIPRQSSKQAFFTQPLH